MANGGLCLHKDAAIAADCSLLVPMQLQALSVPQTAPRGAIWADLTPNYNGVDRYQLRRENLFAAPSQPPAAQPGVHLHWTLPAAFTHIEQKQGKAADFPAVPNRWLVVRLWEEIAGELRYTAHIVESNYLGPEPDGTSPWLRVVGSPGLFRATDKIGRAVDLARYKERPSEFKLTAVAPGNLAFASFYPSCRNVFGFYDPQSGAQQRTYSYFVVGWFADSAQDPLAQCENPADWLGRMAKLAWTVPKNSKALPKRILCHGLIQVHWPPAPVDIVGGSSNFKVAIGNSAIDAIAAFVNRESAAQAALRDRVLGQLQFALLQDRPPTPHELTSGALKQRGELSALRSKLHEKAFTALPGGTRWEIDQPIRNQVTQQSLPVVKPSQLALWLSEINRHQRNYDLMQRELAALQREIYFQLHKKRRLVPMRLDEQVKRQRAERLQQRIDNAEREVDKLRGDLGNLAKSKSEIERVEKDIRDTFKSDPAWRGHVLVPRPMPRYWRPNDPTLLLAGVEIPAIQGGDSPLICRVTGQTVSSFSPGQVPGLDYFDVQVDNLKGENSVKELSLKLPTSMPPGVAELLCEALLLDPVRVGLLARLAYRKQRDSEPDQIQIADLTKRVAPLLASHSPGNFTIGTQRANERPASTAFAAALSATVFETSPFKPVFMMWEARYLPAAGQTDLQPWCLDADGVDYAWAGPPPKAPERTAPEYRGYAPLGDSVRRGLKSKTQRPDEIDHHTEGHLVVQSLGGFTEALLMHDATIQPPPLKDNTQEIHEKMRRLVGDQYAVAPLAEVLDTDKFFPIRGGHLMLNRLRVVDTFGRARRVIEPGQTGPSICISHSLAVAGSPQHIRLAPRLAQPARLLFRWLSAEKDEQEFLGDRATQPICGWVIYNRLDRSLLICDAAGRPLGAVQSVLHPDGHDRRGIRWAKRPLEPIEPGAIPNQHLRGFVKGLLNLADATGKCRSPAFEDFLSLIRRIEDTEPRQSQRHGLSVLMGRPLALVRASLRLDLLGPPAVDQSWAQLDAGATASAGFTKTQFEVRLGNRRKGPDGLIGYFPPGDYGLIHLAQHLEELVPGAGTTHEYFGANQAERVTCNPKAPAALLTLLLDPHLGVHISSGILPTKLIDLPADLVSDALSQLELPFLVAPVLGERQPDGVPNIPLPGDMPGKWIWTWRPAPNADAKSAPLSSETTPARSLFKTMALYEGWLALRPN
jgi:hypothetical protein